METISVIENLDGCYLRRLMNWSNNTQKSACFDNHCNNKYRIYYQTMVCWTRLNHLVHLIPNRTGTVQPEFLENAVPGSDWNQWDLLCSHQFELVWPQLFQYLKRLEFMICQMVHLVTEPVRFTLYQTGTIPMLKLYFLNSILNLLRKENTINYYEK